MSSLGFDDLLKLSDNSFWVCKLAEREFPDERALCLAVYSVQQAIEKALKAYVLYLGENFKFTQDISHLVAQCKRLGGKIPESIEDEAQMLTMWESASQYDPYAVFSLKKYKIVREGYLQLIDFLKNIRKAEEQESPNITLFR